MNVSTDRKTLTPKNELSHNPSEQTYRMTMSLSVLEELGIKNYSNIPAVLSEIVANAWDADAENVSVTFSDDNKTITIQDDGCGMTVEEANDRFLTVGYHRRISQPGPTPIHNRQPMGRKGIGKLAVFAIANKVKVYSVNKEGQAHGFEMDLNELRDVIENTNLAYHPRVLHQLPSDLTKGTRIVLTELESQITNAKRGLRQRIARRFSIIGDEFNFQVTVDGQKILPTARNYHHKVQYVWTYGLNEKEHQRFKNAEKPMPRNNSFTFKNKTYTVEGWIGTALNSSDLKIPKEDRIAKNDTLNKIVVMMRGKVCHEDVLHFLGQAGIYATYIIGELNVDLLDLDELDDIATPGRQSISEKDPRFECVLTFVENELQHIQSRWRDLRNEYGNKDAMEDPVIKEWYSNLSSDEKSAAKQLFGKISRMTFERPEDKKEVRKYGILAFERARARRELESLKKLKPEDLPALTRVFSIMSEIESVHYHEIARIRVATIEGLMKIVDNNDLEKVVQEYLFDHLWLLDPSWDRATQTTRIEETVETEFKALMDKEKKVVSNGRFDIKYKTTAGIHVVVELKRPSVVVSYGDISNQLVKYMDRLEELLIEHTTEKSPHIEGVMILGAFPKGWDNNSKKIEQINALRHMRIRVLLYNQLIHDAEINYREFIEKKNEASRIVDLLSRIGEDATESLFTDPE